MKKTPVSLWYLTGWPRQGYLDLVIWYWHYLSAQPIIFKLWNGNVVQAGFLSKKKKKKKKQERTWKKKERKTFDRLTSGIGPSGPFPKIEKECKKNQDKNIKRKKERKTFWPASLWYLTAWPLVCPSRYYKLSEPHGKELATGNSVGKYNKGKI